jgi:hypothetical protein
MGPAASAAGEKAMNNLFFKENLDLDFGKC